MSDTVVEEQEWHQESQWEFIDEVPTSIRVENLLKTVKPVWGVKPSDFIDHVQALPQKKKVKRPHPNNPKIEVDDYVEAYTLYMSVAGRIAMLNAAQEKHGWRVEIEPEATTPTGVPGYLSFETRLVYRVYVRIWDSTGAEVGVRSGTAWVPESGGSQAAGSNPYEKVETSALGRALAGWGFGVLPGSGIASVEEMAMIRGNAAAMQSHSGRMRLSGATKVDRETLLQQALEAAEQVRLLRGYDEEEMRRMVAQYLSKNLGVHDAWDEENISIQWGNVKNGQIELLKNSMLETIRRENAERGNFNS